MFFSAQLYKPNKNLLIHLPLIYNVLIDQLMHNKSTNEIYMYTVQLKMK